MLEELTRKWSLPSAREVNKQTRTCVFQCAALDDIFPPSGLSAFLVGWGVWWCVWREREIVLQIFANPPPPFHYHPLNPENFCKFSRMCPLHPAKKSFARSCFEKVLVSCFIYSCWNALRSSNTHTHTAYPHTTLPPLSDTTHPLPPSFPLPLPFSFTLPQD